MTSKHQIHPKSPLSEQDFVSLIEKFDKEGQVVDDRGRNLIKFFEFKGINVNVKSFKIPHLINQVAYRYFRPSKAERSFEHACYLQERNIGTPQPLAYFEFFKPKGIQNSYYFSVHQDYDITFWGLVDKPRYPDFENILRQFTRFTYTLHNNGVFFKDHSAGNTLIKKNKDQYDFYLIDLNRMKFMELSLDDRIRNFAKLPEDPEIIEIMSDEYAKLYGQPYELIHDKMTRETRAFRKKYERRTGFKKKYLAKNKRYSP